MAPHPWHDIQLPDGAGAPNPAILQIPRGSKVKCELDKVTGRLIVERGLCSTEYDTTQDIVGLAPHRLRELQQFFEDYKKLEKKSGVVDAHLALAQARTIHDASAARERGS